MRYLIFLFFLFTCKKDTVILPIGQSNSFEKTYGSSANDYINSITLNDNGEILIGGKNSDKNNIIHTDSAGNIISYMGTSVSEINDIIINTAGNLIYTSGEPVSFVGGSKIALTETTVTVSEVFTKEYTSGSFANFTYPFVSSSLNGYTIACTKDSSGIRLMHVINTDLIGNIIWKKTLNLPNSGTSGILQTPDGGYVVFGFSHLVAGRDLLLVKLNAAGDSLWSKTYGGSDYDQSGSFRQTPDGGFILCGHTMSYGAGDHDVYLVKTDANGNQQWQQTFGGASHDGAYDVELTDDGGYLIVGGTNSFGSGAEDVYLIKTNSAGESEWQKTFGGTGDDRGHSLVVNGNTYYIGGFTNSKGAGGNDMYLIKGSF